MNVLGITISFVSAEQLVKISQNSSSVTIDMCFISDKRNEDRISEISRMLHLDAQLRMLGMITRSIARSTGAS